MKAKYLTAALLAALMISGSTLTMTGCRSSADDSVSVSAGVADTESGAAESEPSVPVYQLCLILESRGNAIFSQYDMEIYLDGLEIGTVSNGKIFRKNVEVEAGIHDLNLYKVGNHEICATKYITVEDDVTFRSFIEHGSGSITMKDIATEEKLTRTEEEMIGVQGMILADARARLEALGFTNIKAEASGWIVDERNWVVETQSIRDGKTTPLDDEIVLHCGRPNGNTVSSETEDESTALPDLSNTMTFEENAELRRVLTAYYEKDYLSTFAKQYKGRLLEFNGSTDYFARHTDDHAESETSDKYYDVLVSYGDYGVGTQIGPSFKFEKISILDSNINDCLIRVGANLHIIAEVDRYDAEHDVFYLNPIYITAR